MKIVKKSGVCLILTVFLLYSTGICFRVHACSHCNIEQIYFFSFAKCCQSSCNEKYIPEERHSCCHYEEKNKNHCSAESCCHSFVKVQKIVSQYIPSTKQNLKPIFYSFIPFLIVKYFVFEENKILNFVFFNDKEKIPPLLQGSNVFLSFTHQFIFYA